MVSLSNRAGSSLLLCYIQYLHVVNKKTDEVEVELEGFFLTRIN